MVKRQRYAIEICIGEREKNGRRFTGAIAGQYYFHPAGRSLRSRFTPADFAVFDCNENIKALMLNVGKIPGEIIYCDLATNEWGMVDPLQTHKPGSPTAKTVEKLQNVMRSHFGQGSGVKFKNPTVNKLFTPDDEKNILYWMARAIKSGSAVVCEGEPPLPTIDEIKKMPGRRKVDYGSGTADPETKVILSRYDDYVPVTK